MSLVGTRPPTVDEWELYEPHHRAKFILLSKSEESKEKLQLGRISEYDR